MPNTVRYLSEGVAPSFVASVEETVRACEGALFALTDKAGAHGPGRADLPAKVPVAVVRGAAFAHAMPAAVTVAGERIVGLKWIAGDPARPPPTIGGVILLEDPSGGGLRGIVAAAGLTGARTAAVTAAALRAVPPRTERAASGAPWRVALVAGGVQAFSHRAALAELWPEATVGFVTRRPQHELPLREGDDAVGPARLMDALADADVVITSVAFGTVGREIDAAWLAPGATVVASDYATAVTAATLAGIRQQDGDEVPRLIVDDAEQFDATRASGKLPGYPPADATLGQLLADQGGLGRRLRERTVGTTVVVNHLGVAVCDLAVAWGVLLAAEAAGAGVELPR